MLLEIDSLTFFRGTTSKFLNTMHIEGIQQYDDSKLLLRRAPPVSFDLQRVYGFQVLR